MIKKVLCSAFVISMISCSPSAPKEFVTSSGYKYTHVSTGGQKVKEGEYVHITFIMEGSDGSVLQEYGEDKMPIMIMPKPGVPLARPNPVVDMILEGSLGDSMTLIMPIDSFPNGNTNSQIAGMEYVKYVTCIKKIQNETEYTAYQEEQRLKLEMEAEESKNRLPEVKAKTEQLLKDYAAGKLDVKTTAEGLKYVLLTSGDGPLGAVGRGASVHYYGAFMDGKMFDSSFLRGSPHTFPVGQKQVIMGWDLAMPLLKKGATAALFIPYNLAYGEAGKPPSIPAKSDLMFYVELVDVM